MAGLLNPILAQIQSTLVSNVNTEKDLLSSYADIDTDLIVIYRRDSIPVGFPFIEIFPFSDSIVDSEQMNVNSIVNWQIAIRITIVADNEVEAFEYLDVWSTAIVKAIAKNDGWDGSDTADIVRLLSWGFGVPDTGQNVYQEATLLYEYEKEYDFTS